MNATHGSVGANLSVLESHIVRKAARDAGFDILQDLSGAVVGASSHAPVKCVVWTANQGGFLAGFSMGNVIHALEVDLGAAIPATSLPGEMLQTSGAFRVADIPALENLLARAWTLARTLPDALVSRFEQAVVAISATEREATVRQRVGQSLFRDGLMALWGGRCAVTGLDVPELLRASHAKPWADCNDRERLDVYNGFLLSAHWDAAFDAGLVTVSPDGVMLASPALPDSARIVLNFSEGLRLTLQPQHAIYMAWHRERVFQSA